MKNYLYGVDFGTTNSALSIFEEEKGEIIETIIVPSILYFPADQKPSEPIKYFIGQEAIEAYVNEGMKGRFLKSIKKVLPMSSFIDTRIHNKLFTPSDLVTLILKELKKKADLIVGGEVVKVVLGRPVNFDDHNTANDELAQKRLLKAAENAGFTQVRFQYEPIAAAFAYEKSINRKERVLVGDFGGGTTDFTFIQLDPQKTGLKDRRKDIVATGGIYIGGDTFDSDFMWEKGTPYFGKGVTYESSPGKKMEVPLAFFSNICSWDKISFFYGPKALIDLRKYYTYSRQNNKLKNLITFIEKNLSYTFFQSIEKAKIEISQKGQALFSYNKLGIEVDESISLDEYNSIIRKDIVRIENCLEEFMKANNISIDDIDTLFLTGGTSLLPAIQELFRSKFKNSSIKSGDNFLSVAKGLAYSGYLFQD